jgi:hypothetical protein
MLYAILCYDSEDVVGAWTKEEDDAAIAKLDIVNKKLAKEGRLGPVARLMPLVRRSHSPTRRRKPLTFGCTSIAS